MGGLWAVVNKVLLVRKGKRGCRRKGRDFLACSSLPVSMSQNLHNHLAESFIVLMTDKRGGPSTNAPGGYRSQVEIHIRASGSLPAMRAFSPVLLSRALLGGAALILPPGE